MGPLARFSIKHRELFLEIGLQSAKIENKYVGWIPAKMRNAKMFIGTGSNISVPLTHELVDQTKNLKDISQGLVL